MTTGQVLSNHTLLPPFERDLLHIHLFAVILYATMKFFKAFLTFATSTIALSIAPDSLSQLHAEAELKPRQSTSCENTATSRDCWGDYSIDTNYYVRFTWTCI